MKYNVILIMTDQHRFDCLGCYGNDLIKTPNIDELASLGVTFQSAYSAVPSCIPARASLLTGMSQWHTGILGMGQGQGEIPTNFKYTLPSVLADNGYHTQGIGKMHFFPQRALNGFHHTKIDESGRVYNNVVQSDYRDWFEKNKKGDYDYQDHGCDWNSWVARPSHLEEWLHPTHWTADSAIEFLKKRDPEKPYFMKVSFARPHSPYDPPKMYYDMYANKEVHRPALGDWADINDVEGERDIIDAWRSKRSKEEIEMARKCYYANITFIDHQIGRLIYELKYTYRNFDETMIIFTSDHGDMLGDHNLWRKTYAYEGSTHIPLIIKPPRSMNIKGNLKREQVTELRDIMPTILDSVGIDIPDTCDGMSLLPIINNEHEKWRDYIQGEHCACYSHEQSNIYVTDGKYKLIWFERLGIFQFFDLVKDPYECINLIEDEEYVSLVEKYKKMMKEELKHRDNQLIDENDFKVYKGIENIVSPHYRVYGCT